MIDRPTFPQIVGVDTGGTFTDFFFVDPSGTVRVDKLPSCPQDPGRPVLEGIAALSKSAVARIVHGTTVATNALLERKIARTALLTTAGFEDLLEIGRQNRPELYAAQPRKTPPLIPANFRFGVRERILHDGTVLIPIDRDQVRGLLNRIRDLGVAALAVCLLHSYANPEHEEVIRELAEAVDLTVSLSSEVLREFREYERTTTVAVNAALRPVMEGYLTGLAKGLSGTNLSVMQSNGGSLLPHVAARLPVHTVLSGPAGGVIAAAHVAKAIGIDRFITFDMGGTSTDVSLYDRAPAIASGRIIGGHPVHVPMIDIHTVGAGGGSIAFRDSGGGLKVGPLSAGADPGPVCYGKGSALTVTDAHFFLQRMEASFFLGGRMRVQPDRIQAPMSRLADALGLGSIQTAQGILTVANSVMERAIRVISVQRGHDPRDFTLVSFGGSAGLHAAELARSLGIPQVLIPRHPGVFSALGMAAARVSRDFSRTILVRADRLSAQDLSALIREISAEGLAEFQKEGVPEERVVVHGTLDMRYMGQSHEITVAASDDPETAFHGAHNRLYGFQRVASPVQIVTVRARLTAQVAAFPVSPPFSAAGTGEPVMRRSVFFGEAAVTADIFDRELLPPNSALEGPAVVLERTATTFIPPGSRAGIDGYGNMIIEVSRFSS
jgi:N-methylhydantoinase A